MFAAQFTLYRMLERFADDPLKDGRVAFARIATEAAQLYMPFGSGMGTFVPVYAMSERPEDALVDTYVNRAHNDLLELWLEAGVAGLALVAVFLAWLVVRSLKLWRRDAPGAELDLALARAGTVVAALVVAHSLVDYPLRTGAMMAIMAFSCALLTPPPSGAADPMFGAVRGNYGAGPAPDAGDRPRPPPRAPAAPISQHLSERWGRDIEWPEDWR
jgi:hypothetical protein